MTTPPPPGWYEDPHAPGRQRWWGGDQWTEHVRPGDQMPTPQQYGPPPGAPLTAPTPASHPYGVAPAEIPPGPTTHEWRGHDQPPYSYDTYIPRSHETPDNPTRRETAVDKVFAMYFFLFLVVCAIGGLILYGTNNLPWAKSDQKTEYASDIRTNFVTYCVASGGQWDTCNEVLECIEGELSESEYIAAEIGMYAGADLPPKVAATFADCLMKSTR